MNILIFGFGFLGRPLAERCFEHGDNVRAIKRRLTSDDINVPIDLDALELSPESFAPEWAKYETWVITLPPSQSRDYVGAVINLIERAEQCGVNHVIYTSSTSVFGADSGRFDETSDTQPESDNARQIVQIETRLLNARVPNVDVIRLGGLYSSERHPLMSLLRHNTPITGKNQLVNRVHRERALLGLFQAAHAPNGVRVRHFVETPHLSKSEFYAREAKKLGVPLPEFLVVENDEKMGKQVFSVFDDFGFQAA
ncbi:NAD-dependent epimerase/dehydratase family protein [Neisseriaceae bacterium B1]